MLGRASRFGRLSQVADLPEPEALEALESLVNGGLLNERSADQRPYSLAHDYIREVVYSENREARRRVFHRRALLALEAAGAPAVECTYHALASLLDEPALRYSLAAGDQALAKFALEESLSHYDRARDVCRRMAAREIASKTLLHLYQNRGRAFELGQQGEAARDNYQELLDLAETRNDPPLKLTALISMGILHATGISVFNLERAGELGKAGLDLARNLAERSAEARALWCMMLVEHFSGGEVEQVLAYGSQLLAIARQAGQKELVGYVQTNLAWAYFNNEQFGEAHAAKDEARSIWQALGNLPMVCDSYTIKLHVYRTTGQYDALLALEHEALDASRGIKNVLHEGLTLFNICDAYCAQGRFSQAVAALEAARTLAAAAREIPNANIGVFLYSIHAFLSAGDLEEAGRWADQLYALKEAYQPLTRTFFLVAVARARIAQGRLQEAGDILRKDLDVLDQDRPALTDMAPVFVADAHLELAMGHPERALARAHAVIQRLRQAGSRNCLAEAYWLRGRARLALGEELRAREAFREALAAAQVTSERPILWQVLHALSDLERNTGNPGDADRLSDQARAVVLDIAAHAGELEDVFSAQPGVSRLLAGV